MANPTYSKADEKLILGMKKGKKSKPTKAALTKVAKKLKKTTGAVYQKWNALMSRPKLHTAVIPIKVTPPVVSSPTVTTAISPMKFPEINFTGHGKWIDPVEETAMKAGLDEAIKNSFSKGKSIVFPAKYVNIAREYLKQVDPKGAYVFYAHTDKKNTTHKILSKKN